jgi:hypothetical protein
VTNSDTTGHYNGGEVNIPTLNGISSNLAIAFRLAGMTIDETELLTKLSNLYGTDNNENNITLANINEIIVDYINGGADDSSISNIYDNIYNNSTLSISQTYTSDKYTATRTNLGVAQVTYGTSEQEVPTGNMVWLKDATYWEWYNKYMQLTSLQERQFKIVDSDVANSTSFVSNWISEGGAFLLKFEKNDDGSYDLVDTSVQVETSLQEVSDETDLKKAEAKYEADMNRINKKDTRYDNELAKFETERTAIKDEIETLQTVAKENVERTFKLFS